VRQPGHSAAWPEAKVPPVGSADALVLPERHRHLDGHPFPVTARLPVLALVPLVAPTAAKSRLEHVLAGRRAALVILAGVTEVPPAESAPHAAVGGGAGAGSDTPVLRSRHRREVVLRVVREPREVAPETDDE
jgi:hypothetical protein